MNGGRRATTELAALFLLASVHGCLLLITLMLGTNLASEVSTWLGHCMMAVQLMTCSSPGAFWMKFGFLVSGLWSQSLPQAHQSSSSSSSGSWSGSSSSSSAGSGASLCGAAMARGCEIVVVICLDGPCSVLLGCAAAAQAPHQTHGLRMLPIAWRLLLVSPQSDNL